MAGSLIKIDEEIVTSAVASVTLTGIDSTYDVYMVTVSNLEFSTASLLRAQVTTSGTPDTTSNYDFAQEYMKADSAFGTNANTNTDRWDIIATAKGTVYGHSANLYLFNFNNASEYSFATIEGVGYHNTGNSVRGLMGGGVHTVGQVCDGIHFINSAGNFEAGTFTLYGLAK